MAAPAPAVVDATLVAIRRTLGYWRITIACSLGQTAEVAIVASMRKLRARFTVSCATGTACTSPAHALNRAADDCQ
jgi:hypothetical protein